MAKIGVALVSHKSGRDFLPDRDVLPLHEGFAKGETEKKNKKLPSKIGDGTTTDRKSNKINLYFLLKELHKKRYS